MMMLMTMLMTMIVRTMVMLMMVTGTMMMRHQHAIHAPPPGDIAHFAGAADNLDEKKSRVEQMPQYIVESSRAESRKEQIKVE